MVIHRVGEVIGGDAVGFQEDMIHIVLRNGQLPLDQIVELELVFNGAGGTETENPGIPGLQLGTDLLHGAVTPDGIFSVVAGGFLILLLLFPHGGKLLFGAEAGIGFPLGYQLFGIYVVNGSLLTLAVGAVVSGIAVHGGAFVKMDAVVLQSVDEHLHRAGNLSFGIGILHPEEKHTAALVGHPLGGQPLHQVAQMHKASGGGGHTGNDRTLRNLTGRVLLFKRFGRIGYIGKQEIGKGLIIHKFLPLFSHKLQTGL